MEPKIALCFLTYNNLSQPTLWKKYINPKYNIYIHNKNTFKSKFNKYCIPNKIDTQWGDISLVKATLSLFREAYKVEDNEYFILLSDKCIPLYPANELYNKINQLNTNLLSTSQPKKDSLHHQSHYLNDQNFFPNGKWYHQSQWMLLKRETVKFFLDNDFINVFGRFFKIVDEYYFVNIMRKYDIEYKNKRITYINWNETSDSKNYRSLPKTYDKLTNDMVNLIIEDEKEYFFMRKISKSCILPSYFSNF